MAIDYKALADELANFEGAGVVITDIIADPDPILKKRGDDARIFEDIMSDDQVTQATMNRKNRVLLDDNYNWYAGAPTGDTPTPEAELLKDSLCADLERINMTEIIAAILDAPYYGFSVIEIMWEADAGKWHIKDLKQRPNYWFRFDKDGRLCFVGENGNAGNPVPEGKFLLIRHHPKYENPYGIRLLSRCLWPVIFKKAGVKFYALFVEKYGLPFVLGTAAQGAKDLEKQEAAKSLSTLRMGGSGVVPFNTNVQMLAAGGHHTDIHERYINFWNASISKVIMGQTLTAELTGETGSFAASNTHMEVGGDIAKADRNMVSNAFDELGWIYAQVNAPHIAAPVHSYDTPEDLSARADLDAKLYSMGVDFEPDYIEQTYGISKEHFKMRAPQNFMPPQMGYGFSRSTKNEKKIIPIENISKEIQKLTGINEKELSEIRDLTSLQDYLVSAEIDTGKISEILHAVMLDSAAVGLSEGLKDD